MGELEIKSKIKELKSKLTGNLFEDVDLQQEIYEHKKRLNHAIVNNPELDEDVCDSCGS